MNPRLAVDRRPATKTTMEVSDGCQAARWHPTDLTFGRLSPGKDKEANWLPAPDGPICLVMRLTGRTPRRCRSSRQAKEAAAAAGGQAD